MAKQAKTSYTLSGRRTDPFRRTIRYLKKDKDGKVVYGEDGKAVELKKAVLLFFQHGKHIELTDEEVEFLKVEIDAEIIVPTNFDSKGRQRDPNQIPAKLVDAETTIANLEKKIEDLAAENAKLREREKPAGDDKKDGLKDDKTSEPGSK